MLESEASMTDGKLGYHDEKAFLGYHDEKAFLHTESPTYMIHVTRQTTKSASLTKKQQQIRREESDGNLSFPD